MLMAGTVVAQPAEDPGTLVGYRGQQCSTFEFNVTGRTTGGAVWGTDEYTDDSTLAIASVHAGMLAAGETGVVRVQLTLGSSSYVGSTRNGVTTFNYGSWPYSYSFLADGVEPLAINAGADQAVTPGATVQLLGTADDPGLSIRWQQVSGPAVTLSDESILNPTFVAPLDIPLNGSVAIVMELSAGGCARDTVTISVQAVDDTEAPVLTGVPADIAVPTDPGLSTAGVTWTPPTASDNVDGPVTPVQTAGPTPGAAFPLGTTTITYSATDAAGNVATASFTVTVGDAEAPVLAGVPADIAVPTDPGLVTAVVTWTPPTASDNVDGPVTPVQTAGLAPGSAFPVGVSTITYTAIDAAGNAATASFTVTVGDTEAPVLTGVPADIAVPTDPGLSTAVVTWTPPSASDNVDGPVTPVQTAGPAPGAAFPLGATTITYSATDAAGNAATASFAVTVGDGEAPVFAGIPADISAPTDPGLSTAVVTWTAPSASDNVDGTITPVQTAGPAPGAAFALGATTVTYSATDAAGNSASASFTVTVTLRPADPLSSGIEASPSTLLANGSDTSQITVTVRDATGTLLGRGGMGVVLTTSLGTLGPVLDLGDGRYRATLVAGTLSGSTAISATLDGTPIAGQALVVFEPDRAFIAGVFTDATRAFIQRRIDRVLASEPRQHRLENRREAQPGLRFALSVDGHGPEVAGRFDIAGLMGARPTGGLDLRAAGAGTPSRALTFALQSVSADRRWYAWAEGQYSRYRDATGPLEPRRGSFGILHLGGDYLVHDRLSLGLMATLDRLGERVPGVAHLRGTGWMLGPYAATELVDGVFLTARAAWGQSHNSATIDVHGDGNLWQGDFATRRALMRLTLSGTHERDGLILRPQLDLAWMEERQRDYAVTDGRAVVEVAGIRATTGRLSASAEVEWPVMVMGGELRAFVIPTLSWDFAGTGRRTGHAPGSGSLELGLRTGEQANWRGQAAVRADGLGQSGFRGVTVRLGLDRQF